jgi:4-amino-4-deoxy-L-arabinose transferase-like glycosyltransferase
MALPIAIQDPEFHHAAAQHQPEMREVRPAGPTLIERILGGKGPGLFVLFLAAALLFRSPTLLYLEANWDEWLYWMMGGSLIAGHAPYMEFWDRKPVGLFVLTAAAQALFGDSAVVLRLGTSVLVGTSAWCLAGIGRRMFLRTPEIGFLAGFFYVFASLRSAGEGANAELLLAPFALGGFWLALRVMHTGRRLAASAAGLLFGIAVHVKEVALFDLSACAVIVALPLLRARGLRALLRPGLAMALGVLVPLAVVLGWYGAIGQLGLFLAANVTANLQEAAPASLAAMRAPLLDGLRSLDLLVAGTVAAAVVLPWRGGMRSLAAIAVWLGCVALALLCLRRFADHMFLQALPVLALATAAALGLAVRALPLSRTRQGLVLGLALLFVAAWGGGRVATAAVETVWQRQAVGVAHWGDRTATIAAAIRPRLAAPGHLYVAGRLLGLYHATGTVPPTRFPFTEHLWAPYAPVDGTAEMARILAGRPRFVVVDDLWAPGRPPNDPAATDTLRVLHAALARDYARDGHVGRFDSRGGGFVGGGVGATIFRRADVEPFRPGLPALAYDP